MLVAPGFPGHRTLMLAVPLGAVTGLVAVRIAELAGRGLGRGRAVAVGERRFWVWGPPSWPGSLGSPGFGRPPPIPERSRRRRGKSRPSHEGILRTFP